MTIRDFNGLLGLLSGAQPLPDSKFVSYNLPLSAAQLKELEPLLKEHSTLRGIRFRGCRVNDAGAEALARVIAFNSTLEVLELPGNQITGLGATFLCNALRNYNFTLRCLVLHDNPCLADARVMAEIALHLARNKGQMARTPSPRMSKSPFKIRELEIPEVEEVEEPNNPQLDRRVLCLENDLEVQAEEMEKLRELGINLSSWKSQLDVASGQMAQVLEMLKQEIDDLRERVAAQASMPPPAAAGPDVTTLAAQFRSKHEELQQSLDKLQQASKAGASDAHTVLLDTIAGLNKRVDALEQDSTAQEMVPALDGLCQQAQQLEGQLAVLRSQQDALEASSTSASQLAAEQQQALQEALALGPQVEQAIAGLETLQALVMGVSEETTAASAAAELTSSNVAQLVQNTADLQQRVNEAFGTMGRLEGAVVRVAGEAAEANTSAATATARVYALELSQGELQQEVGKLQLAVGVLEQSLDSLDACARLEQQTALLQQVQSSQEEFKASAAEQLADAQAQLVGAEAAIAGLQSSLEAHPWQADIAGAVQPLQQELLAASEAMQRSLGEADEAVVKLQAASSKQPGLWRGDIAAAIKPVRLQLQQLGAVQEQQKAQDLRLVGVEEQLGGLGGRVAGTEAVQAALGEQLVQWERAMVGQLKALEGGQASAAGILSSVQESVAGLAEQLSAAVDHIAELRAIACQHPAQWERAVQDAVGPLAAHQEQHAVAAHAFEEAAGGIQARMMQADAAIAGLRAAVGEQFQRLSAMPAAWEGALEQALCPVQQDLAALRAQHCGTTLTLSSMEETLAGMAAKVAGAQASITSLEAEVKQHPAAWQAALEAGLGPLQEQVGALQQSHSAALQSLQATAAALASQLAAAEAQVAQAASSSELRALLEEVAEREAVLPVQLESLHAAMPMVYDDAALASRLACVEGALGTVHASVDAQVAGVQREVAAVRESVEAMQATAAAAAGKGMAEEQVLLQLTAAVDKLSEGQAVLHSRLEVVGQDQMHLASRVEALPALLLAKQEGTSALPSSPMVLPLPLPSGLGGLSPASTAGNNLESHPLLTARSWAEESASDEDEWKGADELVELRANLVVQAKHSSQLERKVQTQAKQIDRLEGQLQQMRMLMTTLTPTGYGQLASSAAVPTPSTQGVSRRPVLRGRPTDTPISTFSQRTAYYDAYSEAGEAADGDFWAVPMLSAPRMQHGGFRTPWGPSRLQSAQSSPSRAEGVVIEGNEGASGSGSVSSSADTSFSIPTPAAGVAQGTPGSLSSWLKQAAGGEQKPRASNMEAVHIEDLAEDVGAEEAGAGAHVVLQSPGPPRCAPISWDDLMADPPAGKKAGRKPGAGLSDVTNSRVGRGRAVGAAGTIKQGERKCSSSQEGVSSPLKPAAH